MKGDILKTITNCKFNVDNSHTQYRKLMFHFSKGINFDERGIGAKNTTVKSRIRLVKSPVFMAGSLISNQKDQKQNGCLLILRNFVIY